MSDTVASPPVEEEELLARFVTVAKWVREDQTIRQDAFIPPKDLNLSVTRHLVLSQDELWAIGQAVADAVAKHPKAVLYGSADIRVRQVTHEKLRVEPAPLPENENHAHITGWPDKAARKSIAQSLADAAGKVVPPPRRA